jgi:transposase
MGDSSTARGASRKILGHVLVERSLMEQRYQAVLEVQAGVPIVDVAKRFGVSRQAVHRWVRRYESGGLEALADRSRRPKSSPWQVPAEVEALVCEMRRSHPRWGPRRIRAELAKRPEFVDGTRRLPHRSSIYRVLVRFDLLMVKPRRRKRSEYKRWQRDAPMELWQLDIVGSCFLTPSPAGSRTPDSLDHLSCTAPGVHLCGRGTEPGCDVLEVLGGVDTDVANHRDETGQPRVVVPLDGDQVDRARLEQAVAVAQDQLVRLTAVATWLVHDHLATKVALEGLQHLDTEPSLGQRPVALTHLGQYPADEHLVGEANQLAGVGKTGA